jgi:hypothetical protein
MRTKLRGKVTLLFMTLGLLLAIPAVAFADNIQDNIADNVTSALQLTAGDATSDKTAEIRIIGNNSAGDPDNGCNFDPSTTTTESLTISFTTPSGVTATAVDGATATPGQMLFTACGVDQTVKLSASSSAAPGDYTVTANIVNNNTGGGTFVNQVSIPIKVSAPAKQNQTISFAANTPTSKTFGDANFNVSATATSGLQVSYAAKAGSSCTVSNVGLVSLTGAGTCTVVASQAGNTSYNAAPNVEHAITVGKATPTITWSNPTAISYPTALSGTQLNATAQGVGGGNLAGDFVYNPASGAVLNAGTHQLNTTFTPTNTTDYTNANANVSLDVNQASQTINFTSTEPANAIYGSTYTPEATGGGSGNPVTFDASGDCSYNSTTGKVTMTAAGTCTVTADQAGNPNYSAAPQASQEFSVGKRPVTVTPNSGQNKVYGDDDPNLDYQVTSGSVINNDPFSGSLGRALGNDVGNYQINLGSLSLGNNYNLSLSSNPVNFEITQRPITVKAANVTRVYGDSTPAFSLALASGSLGYSDSLTDSFGTQVQFSPAGTSVGEHPIDVSGLSNSNYNISYASGTARGVLTVTPRPLEVTADAKSKTYGEDDPDLTYEVTSGNLVGNDSLSGNLTRQAGKNVGTYAIQQGTLTAGSNYDLSYVGANLTIDPRPITVTADAKSKIFSDPDPALTYQRTSGTLVDTDSFTGSLTRDPGEAVGQYNILQGTLKVNDGNNGNNYAITYVGAKLTIGSWSTKGFYQPVDMGDVLNTVKNGSTVPVKFELFKSVGGPELTSTSDVSSVSAKTVSCTAFTGDPEDAIEMVATGGTTLRYDATGGQFIYNWQTPKKPNTCYNLTMTAKDGSTISAYFKLK